MVISAVGRDRPAGGKVPTSVNDSVPTGKSIGTWSPTGKPLPSACAVVASTALSGRAPSPAANGIVQRLRQLLGIGGPDKRLGTVDVGERLPELRDRLDALDLA